MLTTRPAVSAATCLTEWCSRPCDCAGLILYLITIGKDADESWHPTEQEGGDMPTAMIQDPAKAKEFFEAKMAFTTGPVELERMMKEGSVNVVDVRAADDYAKGHIPGAVNLPKERWASLQGLRKDRTNVIYCYSIVCHLGATAAVEFAARGFSVMELDGGWRWWKDDGFPIET
jgi:rhodanese-related sulfurtransferase